MYRLILFSSFIVMAGSARIPSSVYGGGYDGLAGGYGGGYGGGGYGGGGYPGMFGGFGGDMWGGLWGGKAEGPKRKGKVEEDVSVNCRVVERNRTDDGREVVGPGDCMSIKQLTTALGYDGEMVTEMMGGACSWREGSSHCLCPADKETCTSSGRSGCYLHTDSKTKVFTCISKAERFHNQLAGLLAKRGKKDFSMKIKYGASAGKGRLPYGLMGPRYIETGRNPYMQQQYGNGGYGGGVFGGYGGGVGPYYSVGYGSTPYGYGGQSGAYGATHGFGGFQQPAYGTQPQGYPVGPQTYLNSYGPTQPYQPHTPDYQQSRAYSPPPSSYQPPTNYQQPPTYSQAPPSYQPPTNYQQPPTYSQATPSYQPLTLNYQQPAPPSYQPPTNLDYQQPPTYSPAPPHNYQQQPYQETSKPL